MTAPSRLWRTATIPLTRARRFAGKGLGARFPAPEFPGMMDGARRMLSLVATLNECGIFCCRVEVGMPIVVRMNHSREPCDPLRLDSKTEWQRRTAHGEVSWMAPRGNRRGDGVMSDTPAAKGTDLNLCTP